MNLFSSLSVLLLLSSLLGSGTVAAASTFDPLFRVGRVSGRCLILRPGLSEYEVAVAGRAYPFGSRIRTEGDGNLSILLSSSMQFRVGASSAVVVKDSPLEGPGVKHLLFESGSMALFLPMVDEDAVGLPIVVETPVATFDRVAGRVEFRLEQEAEAHRLMAATAIGMARVQGPQFAVERMRRSSSIEIVTAFDQSYTALRGKSGDNTLLVERGADEPYVSQFGPRAEVKIWRRHAAVSGRLAVSVMATTSGGSVHASFAYLEGESAVSEEVPTAAPEAVGGGDPAEFPDETGVPAAADETAFPDAGALLNDDWLF